VKNVLRFELYLLLIECIAQKEKNGTRKVSGENVDIIFRRSIAFSHISLYRIVFPRSHFFWTWLCQPPPTSLSTVHRFTPEKLTP
jgi:hypothetical protein